MNLKYPFRKAISTDAIHDTELAADGLAMIARERDCARGETFVRSVLRDR